MHGDELDSPGSEDSDVYSQIDSLDRHPTVLLSSWIYARVIRNYHLDDEHSYVELLDWQPGLALIVILYTQVMVRMTGGQSSSMIIIIITREVRPSPAEGQMEKGDLSRLDNSLDPGINLTKVITMRIPGQHFGISPLETFFLLLILDIGIYFSEMIKSYSLCATSHLYQIKCSINSFQPISFSKSLLNFNWNVVSCWLNPTTCDDDDDDDSDFYLNIKDDLTMMTMVTMAMTMMTPGVSSAPPECSPPPIPTFPPRPRCNSDHLGFDYDDYDKLSCGD